MIMKSSAVAVFFVSLAPRVSAQEAAITAAGAAPSLVEMDSLSTVATHNVTVGKVGQAQMCGIVAVETTANEVL